MSKYQHTEFTGGDSINSNSWVVQNLNSALDTWNDKLSEIWTLLTTSPQSFRGGGIWHIIVSINGALKGIGYALVLFFAVGVIKTCGSFTELKKPEVAVKCFIRFVLAKASVTYCMDIMSVFFTVAQGAISSIMGASGLGSITEAALPESMVSTIESVGFFASIPLWAVTLLGSLFICPRRGMIWTCTGSPNHINAMDINSDYGGGGNPVVLKSEFLLSLCEQLVGSGKLNAKEKSIIDRCTAIVYRDYIRRGYSGKVPTLHDFYYELLQQEEPEATLLCPLRQAKPVPTRFFLRAGIH